MKFWALTSYFRTEPDLLEAVLSNPKWSMYAEWYKDMASLVQEQRRGILDSEVPPDLCREAFSLTRRRYQLRGGHLRQASDPQGADEGSPLSALEVYDRYGGDCLEGVLEFGSVRVG